MTLDDLDILGVLYSRFIGTDSLSGISFALNNDPEAQDSCKVRIITATGNNEPRRRPIGHGLWLT